MCPGLILSCHSSSPLSLSLFPFLLCAEGTGGCGTSGHFRQSRGAAKNALFIITTPGDQLPTTARLLPSRGLRRERMVESSHLKRLSGYQHCCPYMSMGHRCLLLFPGGRPGFEAVLAFWSLGDQTPTPFPRSLPQRRQNGGARSTTAKVPPTSSTWTMWRMCILWMPHIMATSLTLSTIVWVPLAGGQGVGRNRSKPLLTILLCFLLLPSVTPTCRCTMSS